MGTRISGLKASFKGRRTPRAELALPWQTCAPITVDVRKYGSSLIESEVISSAHIFSVKDARTCSNGGPVSSRHPPSSGSLTLHDTVDNTGTLTVDIIGILPVPQATETAAPLQIPCSIQRQPVLDNVFCAAHRTFKCARCERVVPSFANDAHTGKEKNVWLDRKCLTCQQKDTIARQRSEKDLATCAHTHIYVRFSHCCAMRLPAVSAPFELELTV